MFIVLIFFTMMIIFRAAMSGGGQSAALGLLAPTTFDKPCLFGFHAAPGGKMNPVRPG